MCKGFIQIIKKGTDRPSKWSFLPPEDHHYHDRGARLMVVSRHTSRVDELQGLAVTQGTGLHSALSDALGLVMIISPEKSFR